MAPERAEVQGFTLPPVPDGGALLETVASGLSAGTELTWFKGTNPYLHDAWDAELGLFGHAGGHDATVTAQASYPIERVGYMEVARVLTSRTPALEVGATVAAAYGHATHHVTSPATEHVVVLPDGLDPLLGVYVAHMGPICANGVLHAADDAAPGGVRHLGEGVQGRHVLVTGAGVVGLLTALFATELGAAAVVVADPDRRRRAAAEGLGLETIDDDDADVAAVVKARWRHGPADHGADVAFQCRGRPESLALALRALRPQATVIDLAFYQSGAEAVRLGEEFHHNGLAIRCAQIGRVPRGCRHLWDRRRLSLETVELLHRRGPDVRRHLVTDVVALDDAPALFDALASRRRNVIQAVFTTEAR